MTELLPPLPGELPGPRSSAELGRMRELIYPGTANHLEPFVIASKEDYLIRDIDGNTFVDLVSSSASVPLGAAREDLIEPLVAAMYKIKDSYNVDRLTQELAAAALLDQAYMRRNRSRILATRRRLTRALERLGFFVHPSEANFLWVRPPAGAEAGALYQALRSRRILVRHFNGPRTAGHLRITLGTDRQADALLAALTAILREGAP